VQLILFANMVNCFLVSLLSLGGYEVWAKRSNANELCYAKEPGMRAFTSNLNQLNAEFKLAPQLHCLLCHFHPNPWGESVDLGAEANKPVDFCVIFGPTTDIERLLCSTPGRENTG
jgi:hypothetical protein